MVDRATDADDELRDSHCYHTLGRVLANIAELHAKRIVNEPDTFGMSVLTSTVLKFIASDGSAALPFDEAMSRVEQVERAAAKVLVLMKKVRDEYERQTKGC